MDFLTLGFLLLIVAVSGLVAYIADNLGRKLGKKRLTLGRMRPRHTAATGVVLSGVLVSLATILLVGVASADVRAWLLYGRRAIADLEVRSQEVKRLESTGKDLAERNQRVSADLQESSQKLLKANNQLRGQQERIRNAETALRQRQSEVSRLEGQVGRLEGQVNRSQTTITRLDEDLQRNESELKTRRRDLDSAKERLAQVQEQIKIARRNQKTALDQFNANNRENLRLTNENRVLETKIAETEAAIKTLTEATQGLEAQRAQVASDLESARDDLAARLKELETANAELARTRSDYAVAVDYNQRIGSTFLKLRTEPITFQAGDEVARLAVPARLDQRAAERLLTGFLDRARREAEAKGARSSERYAAADIVSRQSGERVIPPEEVRRAVLSRIADSPEPVVLLGYSSLNAFRGEPVSLEFDVRPNPFRYRAGEALAETRVDGRESPEAIFEDVQRFLARQVTDRLRKDGIIPHVGSDSPFGTISPGQVVEIVDRINKSDRPMTLEAQVAEDTRAGDVLRLRFDLR